MEIYDLWLATFMDYGGLWLHMYDVWLVIYDWECSYSIYDLWLSIIMEIYDCAWCMGEEQSVVMGGLHVQKLTGNRALS